MASSDVSHEHFISRHSAVKSDSIKRSNFFVFHVFKGWVIFRLSKKHEMQIKYSKVESLDGVNKIENIGQLMKKN